MKFEMGLNKNEAKRFFMIWFHMLELDTLHVGYARGSRLSHCDAVPELRPHEV